MAKLTLLLACVTLGLFGTTKSASFECKFKTGELGTLVTVYYCEVQNSVSITSTDAVQINSISGTHKAGYNNDNVEGFYVYSKGQIHYFPRGLDEIFKNLKGIDITGTGLKEVHQSDLKVFPNLKYLCLRNNALVILEENLFEFNPNLDFIDLYINKISHIDPNVFDKLTKLKRLYLDSNTCINTYAHDNPTDLQNVIRTAKSQCTSSDYSNLEQKVKNLEAESKNLNSEKLKEKLENLENEVKNTKFLNFFQDKFEGLKSAQAQKEQEEAPTTTTTTQKPTTQPPTTITTTLATTTAKSINIETCSALEPKIDIIAANLNICVDQAINKTANNKPDSKLEQIEQCTAVTDGLTSLDESIGEKFSTLNDSMAALNDSMDTKMEILGENVENFKMSALREILQTKAAVKDVNHGVIRTLNFKAEKTEKQIKELSQQMKELSQQIKEQHQKMEENNAKIMKALKIDD